MFEWVLDDLDGWTLVFNYSSTSTYGVSVSNDPRPNKNFYLNYGVPGHRAKRKGLSESFVIVLYR